MAEEPTTRLTADQKKSLTLRELFELEAASKPDGSVPDEIKRHIALLEGVNDKVTGRPVLDMVVGEMDVGQVFGDVISEGKFRDADVKASPTLRSRSSLLITRLNTMFDNAGFGSGYVKKQVENSLGKEAFNRESGWDYKRSRKIPVGFQPDVYQKLKLILGDDSLSKEVRNQLGAHLFGGFRPENIANFKIENYDKEKGILTFYDKKSKKNKFLVVNPAVQGVLNEQIGNQTTGFIFPNAKKNQKTLNTILKNTMDPVSFAKPDGSIQKENFTVYKLRNLNETILTDSGLNESDIDFLNGRKPQSEAAGYVAMAARQRRIKNAANELVASIAGYSGTQTIAQFSADVGISFPEDVLRTKIDRSLLVADEYVAALSDDFLDILEPESGKYSIESTPSADPDLAQQFKNEAIAVSKLKEETALKKSAETKKSRLELETKLEEINEDAIRAKVRRNEDVKKIRDDELSILRGKKPTADAPEGPKTPDDLSPGLKEKLARMGIVLGPLKKVLLGAVGVETARQIIEEPAAFAAETAAEAALTALKVPAGIAGGAVAAMQPSAAGKDSDIYPEMRDFDNTVYERIPSDDMSTRVTEPDTGFLDIDRVPEATPVDKDQGFLSR